MKWKFLAFTALLLGAGPALAQYTLPSIQVRPDYGGNTMTFSCDYRVTPSPTDVESLLQINDRSQTQRLTNKLMDAVASGCASGVTSMVVSRGNAGRSLTWYPVSTYPTIVPAPVYYEPAPVYYEPAPVYPASPVYYEPAPVYVEPAPLY